MADISGLEPDSSVRQTEIIPIYYISLVLNGAIDRS